MSVTFDGVELPTGFRLNNAQKCPEGAKGKRVLVILRNPRGHGPAEPNYDNKWNPMSPPGWSADEKGRCRWSHLPEGHAARAFDIVAYKILGER